jgi:hypothetical protein
VDEGNIQGPAHMPRRAHAIPNQTHTIADEYTSCKDRLKVGDQKVQRRSTYQGENKSNIPLVHSKTHRYYDYMHGIIVLLQGQRMFHSPV